MDRLFEKRWWQIGMLSNRPAKGDLQSRVAIPENGLSNMPDMMQTDGKNEASKEVNEKKESTRHTVTDVTD